MDAQINSLNLSLTGKCNLHCIYCPTERAKSMQTNMNLHTLFSIIDKLSPFESQIKRIELGENGEFLMHPSIIEYLRKLRSAFPRSIFSIFSNLTLMTPNIARVLIQDHLVDEITTTRNSLNTNPTPLCNFLAIRDELKSPIKITVSIHTDARYVASIQQRYHLMPLNYHNQKLDVDEEQRFITFWKLKLRSTDRMLIPVIHSWAERQNNQIAECEKINRNCPLLEGIKKSFYIAPSGDIYLCCYDSNYDKTVGNINFDSLEKICRERARFFELLEHKLFDEIGYPCSHSWTCVKCAEKVEISLNS